MTPYVESHLAIRTQNLPICNLQHETGDMLQAANMVATTTPSDRLLEKWGCLERVQAAWGQDAMRDASVLQ